MRKNIAILFLSFCFLNISCSDSPINSDDLDNFNLDSLKYNFSDFRYILTNNYSNHDTISVFTYRFDNEGRVVSENFRNKMSGSEFNNIFYYDREGKLDKVIRNGLLYERYFYTSNKIVVFKYTKENNPVKTAELLYENYKLIKLTYNFEVNNPVSLFFDFDDNFNVVKKIRSNKVLEEYKEYDPLLENPFYSLKSIETVEALRYYRPISKNVYRMKQVYPTQGDDFSTSMQFFKLNYEMDENSRVVKITGGSSLIYAQLFEYDI